VQIINNIKIRFALRKINQTIKTQQRQVFQTGLDSAKNIGIMLTDSKSQNIDYIFKLYDALHKTGTTVVVLVLATSKIENFPPHINLITLKDFSLLGNPKSKIIKNFIAEQFDILINLDFENNIMLQYLSLLSNAKFKTGNYNQLNINILDLMLNINYNPIMENFITQLKIYTNQLIKK
jgi:hypothetical protein